MLQVHLGERVKDIGEGFCRYANSCICDSKVKSHLFGISLFLTDLEGDRPFFGEFNGIAYEVDQHLVQPVRVAVQPFGYDRSYVDV